ncbi:MAG TPA: N-6 DNA methylase [Myxococcota bacterium]|nr:N-6 DNA methylase [Myxococcota bacterium]
MSALGDHLDWLGYIQPMGLVVSPTALLHAQYVLPGRLAELQETFLQLPTSPLDLPALLSGLLDWEPGDLVDAANLDALHVAVSSWQDLLRPTWAVPRAEGEGWQALIRREPGATDLDERPAASQGWRESPQLRFERLLRETGVHVGLLANDQCLRLVYAPAGESSGHLTFRMDELAQVAGRPLLGALHMLLHADRLFHGNPDKHLPAVLAASRRFQNEVSTRLSAQVLDALRELLRGFELADADRGGDLLRGPLMEDPQIVYGGLITVLLRLVFLLYAEERGLLPADPMWVRHYALGELFAALRADAGRHPDTMDQRFGAWARLLTLFRIIHQGNATLGLPARQGELFDPDRYPFLEGRPHGMIAAVTAVQVPRVPDGVVWRVLDRLLVLDGERLSYRALDVEQIGSVYEAMMGFELRRASAPSLALRPDQVVVSLQGLLQAPPAERATRLDKEAGCKLTGKAVEALRAARTHDDLVRALDRRAADPRVIPEGGLYLQPGEERRRSGSHYTPRALTEPIVRTTLRPILDDLGQRPTPEQILDLKVCDPAMGSGAFLVETCRQLAAGLVDAWLAHGRLPDIPPDEDPQLHARRLVAQRCLYGVDKNPFAVTLAKVSLWLVTLARDHAFTFLNHALHHGDSLVGLTRRQIGRFDWGTDDDHKPPLLAWIEGAQADAHAHRRLMHDTGDSEEPRLRRAWQEAEDALDPARLAGDLCVAAFFAADKDKARDRLRLEHQRKLHSRANADVIAVHRELTHGERPIRPFHWELELPEVFVRATPGFDAIVGNPPFAGKNTIAAACHRHFPAWLKVLHEGSHGNADLVAHFFRRAFSLLRGGGTLGLIATNTVSQGDTRASGLRPIRRAGGWLYHVTRRYKWPGLANVVVSVVHLRKGGRTPAPELDGKRVEVITAFLMPGGPDEDPAPLEENEGKSFQGSIVLGMGFTFDDDNPEATPIAEMHRLIAADPRNAERIFPYIGGEEVNDSPTHAHRRYVIHFGEMGEAEARRWPDLMGIVEEKVKPRRLMDNRESYRRWWWQFAEKRAELAIAMSGLDRVIAIARHQPYWCAALVAAGQVFSEALVLVTLDSAAALATLQSRPHELWARFFGSSMKDDLRYTPSDCFATFPFPHDWTTSPVLEAAGHAYHTHRAALMLRHEHGLTSLYNRFHDPSERDPELLGLRDLHSALDRAVLDAYGWTDLRPEPTFRLDYEEPSDPADEAPRRRRRPWRLRWTEDMEDTVLSRLLDLNRQRAGGPSASAPAPAAPAARPRRGRSAAPSTLFPPKPA